MMSHHILEATDGDKATSLKTGIRLAVQNDPRRVAAARELKDRWPAQVNRKGLLIEARGKYQVSRQLRQQPEAVVDRRLLTAAWDSPGRFNMLTMEVLALPGDFY